MYRQCVAPVVAGGEVSIMSGVARLLTDARDRRTGGLEMRGRFWPWRSLTSLWRTLACPTSS
jgi:hypothetical protein